MPLTDVALKNAKPTAKPYKLHDEGGLFVIVRTTGAKLWRLKFRSGGAEQQLSIGQALSDQNSILRLGALAAPCFR